MRPATGSLRRARRVAAVSLAGALVAALGLWAGGGSAGAQVPTTLPTTAPTTAPPTTSPPTTSRPAPPTTRPPRTTEPAPNQAGPDSGSEAEAPGEPAPTSARPPATGGAEAGPGDQPPVAGSGIDPAQLGDEEDPLITSSASGKLPAIFSWLALVGLFLFVSLLGIQWALTNPARRGSRTL